MADNAGDVGDCRSVDLELLRSGDFSDVKIVCGDRSWDCHRAILVPRSVWFRKALTGPFQETHTRQVNLNEENPICVDLALKYIYGGGLDVESSVSDENFVEHCVLLWHTTDFLLLHPLKASVQKAVFSYCDKRMKYLCMRRTIFQPKWRDHQDESKLQPWALDIVLGIKKAYEWKIEDMKAVLMEFIWVGRRFTLDEPICSTLLICLTDTPGFIGDLLGKYAARPWLKTAVWAPDRPKHSGSIRECASCAKKLSWKGHSEETAGQVYDPFSVDHEMDILTRGWCRDCAGGDVIPWRT